MIEGSSAGRPGDVARGMLPKLTALVALLVDVLPLPNAAPLVQMPVFLVGVAFFWTIYRPDLLGVVAIFLLATLLDGIAGLPLGLTAFSILMVRTLLMPRERFLATTSFIVIWATFVITATAVLGLRWAMACLWWWQPLELRPVVVELALTVAVYPVLSYFLSGLRSLLPRVVHASGS